MASTLLMSHASFQVFVLSRAGFACQVIVLSRECSVEGKQFEVPAHTVTWIEINSNWLLPVEYI
jgi:hypothetical protein